GQLVALMGGQLGVKSEPGKGSTFHFTASFGLAPPPEGTVLQPVDVTGLRVLAVDDNATNRRILHDVLGGWRMQVRVEAEAPAALAELRRAADSGEPYSLVLLDAHMPEMDGFMLADRIQRDAGHLDPTLIMLTSAGRPDDVARCRDLG